SRDARTCGRRTWRKCGAPFAERWKQHGYGQRIDRRTDFDSSTRVERRALSLRQLHDHRTRHSPGLHSRPI
ncbi:hypothetical protein FRC09_000575, partial [Ceratobasidium sp. 395]